MDGSTQHMVLARLLRRALVPTTTAVHVVVRGGHRCRAPAAGEVARTTSTR